MIWYEILLAVRRLSSRNGEFTSRDLGKEVKLSLAVASAWLSKFDKWGYVNRARKDGRFGVWEISDWGRRFRPKAKAKRRVRAVANPRRKK